MAISSTIIIAIVVLNKCVVRKGLVKVLLLVVRLLFPKLGLKLQLFQIGMM
jgi:hypothetical protein